MTATVSITVTCSTEGCPAESPKIMGKIGVPGVPAVDAPTAIVKLGRQKWTHQDGRWLCPKCSEDR